MKFTINRDKWDRGKSPSFEGNYLLQNGKSCVLGHYMLACGVSEATLEYMADPTEALLAAAYEALDIEDSDLELIVEPNYMDDGFSNTTFVSEAIEINDNKSMPDAEREAELIQLFKDFGVELEFTNGSA